jgi:hypothetical protein
MGNFGGFLVKAEHVSRIKRFTIMVPVLVVGIIFFTRQNRQWELTRAAQDGDLVAVKRCMWLGVNVDAEPVCDGGANSGEPAFIAAAAGGHDDVVLFLLHHGANINRQNSCGDTALNAAVIRGHLSTVQLLLSHGANPNLQGEGSPLSNAEERGDTNLIEALKSHGTTK